MTPTDTKAGFKHYGTNCRTCTGSGYKNLATLKQCTACKGSGKEIVVR